MRRSVIALLAILVASAAFGQESDLPFTVAPHDPVTAVAEGPEGAHVTFEVVAYGGRDPNPVVTCNPPSGSLFPLGPNYVRCVATNSFGERAEGGVYVFVYDVRGPVLTIPGDLTVPAEGPDGAIVTFEASADDEIDGPLPVTCSPQSGSRFPVGFTTVSCSATDKWANTVSGTFVVRVTTGEPEVLMIHVPDPITAEAQGAGGAEVTFTVTADGTSDPNPDITCDPVAGSLFPIGTTTVSCVARDDFGNTASDSFEVTVVDTTAPVLFLPDPIVVPADGPDGATVTYQASANDVVDGEVAVTCTPSSGSRFAVGTTTVQCSATDAASNTATGTFTVEVTQEQGTLMIHVPDPITAEAESAEGTVVTFIVTADGTSDPDPQISCDPLSGAIFALGTTTVQCIATDKFGNSAADDFDVTVVDTTAPVLVLPDPIVVPADGPDGATVTYEADANDTVDGEVAVTCAPPSGSRFPVGKTTVECSATDAASNTATGTFTVEVTQEQGTLMIHVPDPITAEAESPDGAVITFTVTADGTSDPDPQISCDPPSGSTFALGTTTVQCVATDRSGNSASDDFDVTVLDRMAPVISAVTASPDVLQAPNKKMVPVTITVEVTDVVDAAPRCFVFDVTSDEDITGDYEIKSDLELELRAERDKDERQYRVHVRCVDASMNESDSSAIVRVPKGGGTDDVSIAAPAPGRGTVLGKAARRRR